ncbi:MAG: hypothetical protein DI582_01705 [Azospirillum brasilense]|nr:MAG: hypothetical protein DI582_01705 [Azospirillum brasilense]
MDANAPQEFSTEVRGHYEELPYPYRDVAQEGKQFNGSDGFNPTAFTHHGWQGKRDLRDGARILIAGDGTGDASINWAESMLGSRAEIVAIDLSSQSIALAKARLAKRQLTNVTHHHMSILDLPTAGLGSFDVIECTGVLHHLPDPAAGLAALGSVLKDDGIMGLMVYAEYGRVAVYMLQDLFRRLSTPDMTRAEKLALARAFLDNVPTTHWITVKNELFLGDIQWPDGSGIYDLLLHSTDRAYTVPQLYEWVQGAGLNLHGLFGDFISESLYEPGNYNRDPRILASLEGKDKPERQAIAELMHGSMCKHNLYVTKQPKEPASFADDMVITYGLMHTLFVSFVAELSALLAQVNIGERVLFRPRPMATAEMMYLTRRPATIMLLQAIDGKRSIGEIVGLVSREAKLSRNDVRKDLHLLYTEMYDRLLVFLRHESVPPYFTAVEMLARLRAIGLIA